MARRIKPKVSVKKYKNDGVVVEIKSLFGGLKQAVKDAIWEAMMETAASMDTTVKNGFYKVYPPVPTYSRTGALGVSYHVETQNKGKLAIDYGNDTRIAPYAVHVEFGTTRMPAKPHLRPAVRIEGKELPKRVKRAINNIVGLK